MNDGYIKCKTDKASDEVYTPEYAVLPILKHIKPEYKTIWCPFDTEESYYVKTLRKAGYNVIATHIDNGQNFFYYEPEEYDCIISNPPYSIKDAILHRLTELDKPYALLLPLSVLQGKNRFNDVCNCEALIFDSRINFFKDIKTQEIQKGISFATIYLCKNFLSEKLIFEKLIMK